MWRRIVRIFGFCGHEIEWSPQPFEGYTAGCGWYLYQRGYCKRCCALKQRECGPKTIPVGASEKTNKVETT